MSMRSSQRFIAQEIMKSKGYTKINKPRTVKSDKDNKEECRSLFSLYWRRAWFLKPDTQRETAKENHRKQLASEAKMILKMHKKGRSNTDIARIMGKNESSVRSLLKGVS